MSKAPQLKPQDVLLLLKLLTLEKPEFRVLDLAYQLGISASEVSEGLERLLNSQLVGHDKKNPLRQNALEFLLHGLRYVFPAVVGPIGRGVPTAHSADPLAQRIVSDERYVWPSAEGTERGQTIAPLYPSVPKAAAFDKNLYELLSIVDTLRIGRVRERKIATAELEHRILREAA